jgi:hypothetical protein
MLYVYNIIPALYIQYNSCTVYTMSFILCVYNVIHTMFIQCNSYCVYTMFFIPCLYNVIHTVRIYNSYSVFQTVCIQWYSTMCVDSVIHAECLKCNSYFVYTVLFILCVYSAIHTLCIQWYSYFCVYTV